MCNYKDNAVSPVIGVMLMLVVTIIIAAVLSSFAGGLAGTQERTPQATISAEYSQSRGMVISHDGGDVLPIVDLQVANSPTRVWGSAADYQTYFINKSVINTNGTIWAPLNAQYVAVKAFAPGDQATISLANITSIQSDPLYNATNNVKTTSTSSYANSTNLGKTFTLKFIDTRTNKPIAQTEVKILS